MIRTGTSDAHRHTHTLFHTSKSIEKTGNKVAVKMNSTLVGHLYSTEMTYNTITMTMIVSKNVNTKYEK